MGEYFKRALKTAKSKGYSGISGLILMGIKYIVFYYINLIAQYIVPHPFLRSFLHRLRGVKIEKNVIISPFVLIDLVYPELITLKEGVTIGPYVKIFSHNKSSNYLAEQGLQPDIIKPVVIKKHSVIGAGAVILPGVVIGTCSVIVPNSVVHQDVPDYCVAGGIPLRTIRKLK